MSNNTWNFTSSHSRVLLTAEAALNLAVGVFHKCRPRPIVTRGICPDRQATEYRIKIGIFYSLQSMAWDDLMLEAHGIRQGFRQDIQGNEYFGSDSRRNTSLPLVVAGCMVSEHSLIPPNGTSVLIGYDHRYKAFAAIRELRIADLSIPGSGFVDSFRLLAVSSAKQWRNTGVNLTMYEYFDTKHVEELRINIDRLKPWTRISLASSLVSYNVSCTHTRLSLANGIEAIVWYRFTQLHSNKQETFPIHTENG